MKDDPVKMAMAEFICERVSEGLTLHEIGAELGVSPGAVLKRANFCPAASERYARARDEASDLFESEILAEARVKGRAPDRTKIDALKWAAAHRRPKVYSERISLDHTTKVETPAVDLTPEQFDIIKAAVLKDI